MKTFNLWLEQKTNNYWIAGNSNDDYYVGQQIKKRFQIFQFPKGAENLADEQSSYKNGYSKPVSGHAVIYPVLALEPVESRFNGYSTAKYCNFISIAGPPQDTKKAQAKLTGTGKTFLHLYHLDSSTYGYHSMRRGEKDIPAEDCHNKVEWEPEEHIVLSSQLEQIIKGNPVVCIGKSQLYFHSCSFRGDIYISFPESEEENVRELLPNAYFGSAPHEDVIGQFPFTSLHDLFEKASEILQINKPGKNIISGNSPYPKYVAEIPKYGQTPEEYWKKRIEIELAKKPKVSGD